MANGGGRQFDQADEAWSPAPVPGTAQEAQPSETQADSSPQPWTSDSEAIERWAAESPLTGASQPWRTAAEPPAAPTSPPPTGPAEHWSPEGQRIQSWTPQFDSGPASGGAEPWAGSAQPTAPEPRSAPEAPSSAASWYDPPPSPAAGSSAAEIEPTQAWHPEPEPAQPWAPDATQAWSLEPEVSQPGATQAWTPEPEAAQPWKPEPDATQAWSPESALPAAGQEPWPRAEGPTRPDDRPAESIVPDSWFAGPSPGGPSPAGPEPVERWTPQPEPANRDPWAAQPQSDPTQAWGQQAHHGPPHGQGPRPHDQTAMLTSDFPPAHGAGYPARDQQQGRASRALIFAVAGLVVVALLAVAFVMWPDGGKESPTEPSSAAVKSSAKQDNPVARRQATAVNSLLNASAASRGELGRALVAAKRCKGLPAAINVMQRVAQQRQQQVTRARTLKVDALSNGGQLRGHLAKSMQISLDVDRAYLTWAQAAQGCKGRPKADPNYRRGGQLSNQATVSKQHFATLWAPVAREQRLHPRTANQF